MDKFLKGFGASVIVGAGLVFLLPLGVFFGWVAGLVLKLFCGSFLASGLNLLFGTSRFSPDSIPMVTGVLAAFSSYLKTTVTTKSE